MKTCIEKSSGSRHVRGLEMKGTLMLLLLTLSGAAQAQFTYVVTNSTITITGYTGPGGAVEIPDTIDGIRVTAIEDWAFYYRTNLSSITIPNSVTDIGEWAFGACSGLTAITVEALNPVYSSEDGVLFDKSATNLIAYPAGKVGSYTIPNSVTSIGDNAFSGCTGLSSVTIPSSVIRIGDFAFSSCNNLTTVLIPNSVTSIGDSAFCYCTSLTRVTIPDGVTRIGDWAFCWCRSLTSVTIPDSVIRIGDFAFWGTSLTNVIIPSSVTSIGDEAFGACSLTGITVDPLNPVYSSVDGVLLNKSQTTLIQCPGGKSGSYTVPDTVSSIRGGSWPGEHEWGDGAGAFGRCTSLTNITIGDSVTTIGVRAFENCTSLTSVTIPSSVTNLGVVAFGYCANLTAITVDPLNSYYSSVDGVVFNKNQTTLIQAPEGKTGSYTIPGSVTNIGLAAFFYCDSLTNVTIPNRVTSIEGWAFWCCSSLTNVVIPDSVTSIGGDAFDGCTGLTSVTIPNSVTGIGFSAFGNCTGLKNVSIGNSLNSIGPAAFAYCYSLTSITIPNSVTNIGYEAFVGCERLVNVTIPGSATSIESDAFGGCSSLRGVYFQGNAPSLGDSVFSGPNSTVYYLPGTTGWGASFGGRPTALWVLPAPLILSQGSNFGLRTNGFGFIISWATNRPVVVEACTNLNSGLWSPVATNALSGGWSDFTDVHWRDYAARFYRVRSQ